jgi:glycosyltransferase involved in cell wall biosynthesis
MEQVISWSEDTEVRDICGFDIGIMPLEESLWERGKCGYKLIQYMGCGLPVVGSPVGINNEIIQEGVNGFKPGDAAGWSKALENLLTDETLRREMGRRGRSIAEERFTLDRGRQQWLDEFSYVLNKQSDRPCVAFSEQSISP